MTTIKRIDAINIVDTWARLLDETTGDPETVAQYKLEYDNLIEFIKNFKDTIQIVIPLSENDLQDLQHGETFDWTFPASNGQNVNCNLITGDFS